MGGPQRRITCTKALAAMLWVARTAKHTPTLAHNALKPQAIARRRAFRKATYRFAPPAVRKRTRLPRARSHTTTRDERYICTVGL